MATFRYIREGERHDGSAVHFSRRDAPRTRVVLLLLFSLRRRSQRVMIRREVDRKNENSSMCRPLLCLPVPRAVWPPYVGRRKTTLRPSYVFLLPLSLSLFCAFLAVPSRRITRHRLPGGSAALSLYARGSALCIQGRGNIEKGLPRWELIQ